MSWPVYGLLAFFIFGCDARSGRATDDYRRIQHVGGAFTEVRARSNDFARFKLHAARRLADLHDAAFGFDVIAGVRRCEETHLVVRRKKTFVAVQTNQQLGGNVPEEREDSGAVDEIAAVVSIVCAHAQTHDRARVLRYAFASCHSSSSSSASKSERLFPLEATRSSMKVKRR